MGLVAFAGLGTVLGSNVESNDGTLLPSIGIGYRYLAFSKQKMNVGLDLAVGRGDWGVYFRIGEDRLSQVEILLFCSRIFQMIETLSQCPFCDK